MNKTPYFYLIVKLNQCPPIRSLTRLQDKHFPYMQPQQGRCKVRGNSKTPMAKQDTKVRLYCPKCNVSLCIGNCFELLSY